MGGSPGLIGNGLLDIELPRGETIDNLTEIEGALIFSQIPGKRNWEELFTELFKDEYPDPKDLQKVVGGLIRRTRNECPSLPEKVMDLYRSDCRLNAMGK